MQNQISIDRLMASFQSLLLGAGDSSGLTCVIVHLLFVGSDVFFNEIFWLMFFKNCFLAHYSKHTLHFLE
jgi:hypothetical protein